MRSLAVNTWSPFKSRYITLPSSLEVPKLTAPAGTVLVPPTVNVPRHAAPNWSVVVYPPERALIALPSKLSGLPLSVPVRPGPGTGVWKLLAFSKNRYGSPDDAASPKLLSASATSAGLVNRSAIGLMGWRPMLGEVLMNRLPKSAVPDLA